MGRYPVHPSFFFKGLAAEKSTLQNRRKCVGGGPRVLLSLVARAMYTMSRVFNYSTALLEAGLGREETH